MYFVKSFSLVIVLGILMYEKLYLSIYLSIYLLCDSNVLASVGWGSQCHVHYRCVYEVADFQFVIHSIV